MRRYVAEVEIIGFPEETRDAIICFADANWYFDTWKFRRSKNGCRLKGKGEDELYGRQTVESVAKRVADAIIEAAEEVPEVRIKFTRLDARPSTTFCFVNQSH